MPDDLSARQRQILAEVTENGECVYGYQMQRSIEALERRGLVTVERTPVMHSKYVPAGLAIRLVVRPVRNDS